MSRFITGRGHREIFSSSQSQTFSFADRSNTCFILSAYAGGSRRHDSGLLNALPIDQYRALRLSGLFPW